MSQTKQGQITPDASGPEAEEFRSNWFDKMETSGKGPKQKPGGVLERPPKKIQMSEEEMERFNLPFD